MGSTDFANHEELRRLARRRLPRFLFDYIDRGTEDEAALARNRAAFEAVRLVPRVLRDVTKRDMATTIFGKSWSMPVMIGPTAAAAMMYHQGETHLATAAAKIGIPVALSGGSSLPIEEAVAIGAQTWFQLYVWNDPAVNLENIARLDAAGAEALIVTADTPVSPVREYNARNGFLLPFRFTPTNTFDIARHPVWAFGVGLRYALGGGLPVYGNVPAAYRTRVSGAPRLSLSPSLDWDMFADIRRRWQRPLLLKGVMSVDDAVRGVDAGADGIIVSNHGGRNLDSTPASLDLLPRIADAVGGRATVLLDSGVRRGSDVAKALALGAKAVLLGRMPLFAVSLGGARSVEHLFGLLGTELSTCMAMIGRTEIGAIDRGVIHDAGAGR